MKRLRTSMLAALCLMATTGAWSSLANAQAVEIKEKPRMYTYVALWDIPRARWADMEKATAGDQKVLDKALASGAIVMYAHDTAVVHHAEGGTHDGWWASMSMAGLLNTLDEMAAGTTSPTSVLLSATKHSDQILVSRYYNWRSGSVTNGYGHDSEYKLKADAPDDAVELLAKNLFAPALEKLLADGTINEYDVSTEAIHTDAPGSLVVTYVTSSADNIDKINAAMRENATKNPLGIAAIDSIIDWPSHRDYLMHTNAKFK